MKKVFNLFLPVLLICIGFVSCEKDDDILGNSSNLIGTWKMVEVTGYEKVNGELDEEWNWNTVETILEEMGAIYWRFDKDGSVHIAGKNINEMHYLAEWEIKKNKLYFYFGDEDDELEIPVTELTSTKMVTEEYWKDKYDGVVEEYYEKIVFSKVN